MHKIIETNSKYSTYNEMIGMTNLDGTYANEKG